MLSNYILIAWRQLAKNKLYATINIIGLAVGLIVYVLGSSIVDYEESYDLFWENSERIFTVGSLFGPSANIGVSETDGIYTAFAPFIKTEIDDIEAVARTVGREFLVSINNDHYYQRIQFADPEFLQIFDFDYLEGDPSALTNPQGVLLTADAKKKFFGSEPALGKTLKLDHNVELHVSAVVENLPKHTHLSGSITSSGAFEVVAPLDALNQAIDYDLAGNFNNLSSGDNTYILVAQGRDRNWLQSAMDGIFQRHYPDPDQDFIAGLKVRELVKMNTVIWDAVGLPVMDSVRLLALLVLIVAIVNYTNLATAQSLGRIREIGMRKTMGATRSQLVGQFLIEGLAVVLLSMCICILALTVLVPFFNDAWDKSLSFDLLTTVPWLLTTTVLVGLAAGAYPAILITRTSPIEALRAGASSGASGGRFRTGMLILQFAISIFMLAMVAVVFLQNKRVEESAEIYPKSQILTLSRLRIEAIQARLGTLRNEVLQIPGVEDMTYASQLPFEQSNSGFSATREPGNKEASMLLNQISVDGHFFKTLDIPIIAGRTLDNAISADTVGESIANVILNELALNKLGFSSPGEALGQQFYDYSDDGEGLTYTIVGVVPDQNFQGFHNEVKPLVFKMRPSGFSDGAIRVRSADMAEVRAQVEAVWTRLVPDYPVQAGYLEDEFQDTYSVYRNIANILGGFALVAMLLSLMGLFGLAAFMAASRTKEIGIRKVMGASSTQITRLLIWRFSKPVMWALLIALPLSYLAANQFLLFFADRIDVVEVVVLCSGVIALLVSWFVVGIHAARIAKANPIVALRYE